MKDRRYYERFEMKTQVLIYKDSNFCECVGEVGDVCENGISLYLTKDDFIRMNAKKDDMILFQFVDSFYYGANKEEYVVAEKAKIIHTHEEYDCYRMGCYVTSPKYAEYIVKKHFALILEQKKSSK